MAKEEWKTINGAHVRIRDGQSVDDAFDESVKSIPKQAYKSSTIPGEGERAPWAEKEPASGATSGAIDPESERGQEHAERFYEEMRHRKDDIHSISKNTGFTEGEIEKVKNYVFVDEHNLAEGKGRFYPNCDMAISWQKMINGNFTEADILMIKHELMEISLVEQGYSQSEAHDLTNKTYNYSEAINKSRKELKNGKIEKYNTQ